jgi:hypothetical protein
MKAMEFTETLVGDHVYQALELAKRNAAQDITRCPELESSSWCEAINSCCTFEELVIIKKYAEHTLIEINGGV